MLIAQLRETRAPTRCAYCHADLGSSWSGCPRCGTCLHDPCARALVACPTLGCRAWPVVLRASVFLGVRRHFLSVFRAAVAVGFVAGLVALSIAGIPGAPGPHRAGDPMGSFCGSCRRHGERAQCWCICHGGLGD
ncbi:MAG: hypothetical protein ACAI25_03475 [Planctomycetota bacterium]